MAQLSDRILAMQPSATLVMSQKSAELKAAGLDIINLSVGEPDFDTPAHIKEAAKEAIDENWTRYTPIAGYPELRRAVAKKFSVENGLEYDPSQIIVSNGAKQSLCNILISLVNPGDEVIIPAPYWVSYPQMTILAGGTPVTVTTSLEENYKIGPEKLEAAITPKSKLIILCSPSNPSGSLYSSEELEALAKVILSHDDLYVISDEIYEHLNYSGKHHSIASVPGMKERTVVVNGVSKAYAMTGWRIGYAAGPQWIIKGAEKLQGQFTGGASSISQRAALKALEGDQGCVEEMLAAFKRRRDLIVKLFRETPGFEVNSPEGAFYLLPRCSSFFGKTLQGVRIENSSDFAMFLLEKAHVATVGGDAFGAPQCLRLSFATSDENIVEAVRRIREALSER